MSETMTLDPGTAPLNLLADWIARDQLAQELMITPDTLSRWEARREGPPCMRVGRKVFYRRTSVEQWLLSREQSQPVRQRKGRR
jgi:hypothetical protein